MSEFILHHTHQAEECAEAFAALKEADSLREAATFFCSCPSGEHGGFFQLEAASPDEALSLLPERLQATTHAYSGETMEF